MNLKLSQLPLLPQYLHLCYQINNNVKNENNIFTNYSIKSSTKALTTFSINYLNSGHFMVHIVTKKVLSFINFEKYLQFW